MDISNLIDPTVLLHWLNNTPQLLLRICVLIVAALISIRFEWLRQVLLGAEKNIRRKLGAILVFSVLAIIGTHSGLILNFPPKSEESSTHQPAAKPPPIQEEESSVLTFLPFGFGTLPENKAIISFRDTMTMMSGMIGGPWVGLGVGLLAGGERFILGSDKDKGVAKASGVATLTLGFLAGFVRCYRPQWITTAKGVFVIALMGTLLQSIILVIFIDYSKLSWDVVREVLFPLVATNCLGCVLFFWVMKDLDRERAENEAKNAKLLATQAQFSVLRAQIEPHFLNNCLNNLKSLIRTDPDKARDYVVALAGFFNATRKFSGVDLVSVEQEKEQLQRYLNLLRLAMGRDESLKLQEKIDIAEELYRFQIIPFTLVTQAENFFKHGKDPSKAYYQLDISAEEHSDYLQFKVIDNGVGISEERLEEIFNHPVISTDNGGGVALYQLQQSLKLMFGNNADCAISSQVGVGTTVTLKQPKRSKI